MFLQLKTDYNSLINSYNSRKILIKLKEGSIAFEIYGDKISGTLKGRKCRMPGVVTVYNFDAKVKLSYVDCNDIETIQIVDAFIENNEVLKRYLK